MTQPTYQVIPTSSLLEVKIIDAVTGRLIRSVRLKGEIVGAPAISGKSFTVITKNSADRFQGTCYGLPSGAVLSQYPL